MRLAALKLGKSRENWYKLAILDLQQAIPPFCASVFSTIKWGRRNGNDPVDGGVGELQEMITLGTMPEAQ